MIKATELTPKSWLLSKSSKKLGLLRETKNDGYAIIGGPYSGDYSELKDLEKATGQPIKFVKPEKKEEKDPIFVEGYPVKHEPIFLIESDVHYFVYTKKEGSQDQYGAGYFCIQFKGKWQSSYCPRIKTLEEHPWIGPFKTKLEMDHTIRVENNK